jgi:D-glycero-alpha-D-manno-heptose-7-phosphate kinase
VLKQPIGKQDQYAAAFGGLNVFGFRSNGTVTVEHQGLVREMQEQTFGSMLMFWTGHQRDAAAVLTEQRGNIEAKYQRLVQMRDQAMELQSLVLDGRLDARAFGRILNEGWRLKRGLASSITTGQIDGWYEAAMAAGAHGGKLCGAGGGGFLLLVAPPQRHDAIRRALHDLAEMSVEHEAHGSQLVLPYIG